MLRQLILKLLSWMHNSLDRAHSDYLLTRMHSGKGVILKENALIYCPERVTLSDGVVIGSRITILAQGGVEIGKSTIIGPKVTILTVNHDSAKPKSRQGGDGGVKRKPVIIGRDVFIAADVTILPGVKIGDRSAIAAGSVVNSNIPENCIACGNPAEVIRERYPKSPGGAPVPTVNEPDGVAQEFVMEDGEAATDEEACNTPH